MEELAHPVHSVRSGESRPVPQALPTSVRSERPSEPDAGVGAPDARSAAASEPGSAGTTASSDADTLRWRQLLAGSPREVLSRIVADDPLGVRERVAAQLRDHARLLDADRVHLRGLARCARSAARYHGRPELRAWIDERVLEAIDELLLEDFESEREGAPPVAEPGSVFVALAKPLGLEPESMRRACVAFNQLPFEDRRAFFDLVILARPLDDLARESDRGATEIARSARRALETIVHPPTSVGFASAVQEEELR